MDYADPTGTSRSVQSLTLALDDAERFHPPEAALQTKQFLAAIRGHLAHTLRIADVKEELLATLAAVADFAYGWGLLDSYVARLQAEVTVTEMLEIHYHLWAELVRRLLECLC